MSTRPRLCYPHALADDETRATIVDPDDCDACRLERLQRWADEHSNRTERDA